MSDAIVHRAIAEPIVRSEHSDGLTLEGYAAVFNSRAHIVDHLGEYDEVIKPGAFTRSIGARTPFLMYQHGRHPLIGQYPLGRIETLREDSKGLFVQARMTDSWITAPVRDGINNGAISGMSIAFESPKDKVSWSNEADGVKLRTVHEAKLYELGPVLGEAYAETSAMMRSALAALGADPELADAVEGNDDFAARVVAAIEGLDPETRARLFAGPEPAELGRQIVDAIRSYESRGGAETRSQDPDTPEGPAEAGTPEGLVEESAEPTTREQRMKRARFLQLERLNIKKKDEDA
jgi:HK97 family phage prohead protease